MKKWKDRGKKEKLLLGVGAAVATVVLGTMYVRYLKKISVLPPYVKEKIDIMDPQEIEYARTRILMSLGGVRKRLKVYDFSPENIHEIWDDI